MGIEINAKYIYQGCWRRWTNWTKVRSQRKCLIHWTWSRILADSFGSMRLQEAFCWNSGFDPHDTDGAQCDNVLTLKKSFHSTTWQPLTSDLFLAPTLDMTRSWTKPQNYPSKSVCTQCALNVSVKWMMSLQSASRALAMPQKPLLEHCLAPFRRAQMSS